MTSKLTASRKGRVFATKVLCRSHSHVGLLCRSLAKHHQTRFPQPGTIIASTLTSPIDALYLAAIFDPIFTASYPSTRLIRRISLLQALTLTFSTPQLKPPRDADLTTLQALLQRHPKRTIVVFPECTTTNGRAILPLSPSLLTTPPKTSIFPTSLRYSPADITTPLPGSYFTFFWNLMSKPTHCIRIRIAESVYNNAQSPQHSPTVTAFSPRSPLSPGPWSPVSPSSDGQDGMTGTNGKDEESESDTETLLEFEEGQVISDLEKKVLDRVGESLARMGSVKRVGLGVREKSDFVKAWTRQGQGQK